MLKGVVNTKATNAPPTFYANLQRNLRKSQLSSTLAQRRKLINRYLYYAVVSCATVAAVIPTCWIACNYCSVLHVIIVHETTALRELLARYG